VSLYRASFFINVVATGVTAGAVLLAVFVFCRPDPSALWLWTWQSLGVLSAGVMIQLIAQLLWLQREQLLSRWGGGDADEAMRGAIVDLLYFTLKAAGLSFLLWSLLGVISAWLFVQHTAMGWQMGAIVYIFMLAGGGISASAQIYFYRRVLLPRLERVVANLPASEERWLARRSPPYSVRAKLLMHNLLSLGVALVATLAAGFAMQWHALREANVAHVGELLEMIPTTYPSTVREQGVSGGHEALRAFERGGAGLDTARANATA